MTDDVTGRWKILSRVCGWRQQRENWRDTPISLKDSQLETATNGSLVLHMASPSHTQTKIPNENNFRKFILEQKSIL